MPMVQHALRHNKPKTELASSVMVQEPSLIIRMLVDSLYCGMEVEPLNVAALEAYPEEDLEMVHRLCLTLH